METEEIRHPTLEEYEEMDRIRFPFMFKEKAKTESAPNKRRLTLSFDPEEVRLTKKRGRKKKEVGDAGSCKHSATVHKCASVSDGGSSGTTVQVPKSGSGRQREEYGNDAGKDLGPASTVCRSDVSLDSDVAPRMASSSSRNRKKRNNGSRRGTWINLRDGERLSFEDLLQDYKRYLNCLG